MKKVRIEIDPWSFDEKLYRVCVCDNYTTNSQSWNVIISKEKLENCKVILNAFVVIGYSEIK